MVASGGAVRIQAASVVPKLYSFTHSVTNLRRTRVLLRWLLQVRSKSDVACASVLQGMCASVLQGKIGRAHV